MATEDQPQIFHLGWRANGDSLDVALALNRLIAAGVRAWRISTSGPAAEAGD